MSDEIYFAPLHCRNYRNITECDATVGDTIAVFDEDRLTLGVVTGVNMYPYTAQAPKLGVRLDGELITKHFYLCDSFLIQSASHQKQISSVYSNVNGDAAEDDLCLVCTEQGYKCAFTRDLLTSNSGRFQLIFFGTKVGPSVYTSGENAEKGDLVETNSKFVLKVYEVNDLQGYVVCSSDKHGLIRLPTNALKLIERSELLLTMPTEV